MERQRGEHPRPARVRRALALGALGGVALFCAFMMAAMRLYPGGTAFDRTTRGHSFWSNFWCDLRHSVALSGAPNHEASLLAAIAFFSLVVGLLPFWRLLADETRATPRMQRTIWRLGVLGSGGMALVMLMPSDHFPRLHGTLVTLAGPCGIAAAVLGTLEGFRSRSLPSPTSLLGLCMLVAALANLAQYARQFWLHTPGSALLPTIQKLATALFLSWVVAISVRALRRPPLA